MKLLPFVMNVYHGSNPIPSQFISITLQRLYSCPLASSTEGPNRDVLLAHAIIVTAAVFVA